MEGADESTELWRQPYVFLFTKFPSKLNWDNFDLNNSFKSSPTDSHSNCRVQCPSIVVVKLLSTLKDFYPNDILFRRMKVELEGSI